MRLIPLLPALLLIAISSSAARADDIFITTDGTNTFTFGLDTNPADLTPDVDPTYNVGFTYGFTYLATVDYNNGTTDTFSQDYISFYDSEYGGGFDISDMSGNDLVDQFDPAGYVVGNGSTSHQDYGGTESNPTFTPGGPFVTQSYLFETNPAFDANFTSNIVPTPEPNSMILLGTGLLGVMGAARRRFR